MSDLETEDTGTTPESEEIEESTSQEESEEAAAPDSTAQAADETGEEEESAPAKGRSSKLQKLLNKYGGDEDKLAEAIYESYNSGSRLKQELDELREQLEDARKPATPQESPDVAGIKEQISALDSEGSELVAEERGLISDHQKVSRDLARLEGKLEDADDLDKPRLTNMLHLKQLEERQLQKDWKDLQSRKRRHVLERADLDKRLKKAEQESEAERARQTQSKAEERRGQQSFLADFRVAVDEAADDLGLVDDEDREYFHNVIKAEAIAYLRAQPDAPGIDPEEFVTARAKAFAKVAGLAKKKTFTEKSKTKIEASGATKPGNKGAPRVPTSKLELPKGKMTREQAEAWRARILGG